MFVIRDVLKYIKLNFYLVLFHEPNWDSDSVIVGFSNQRFNGPVLHWSTTWTWEGNLVVFNEDKGVHEKRNYVSGNPNPTSESPVRDRVGSRYETERLC